MFSRRVLIALVTFPRLFLHAGTQVAPPERRQVFGLPGSPTLLLLDGPKGPHISATSTSYLDILEDALVYFFLFGAIVYLMIPRSQRSNIEKQFAELKYVSMVVSAVKYIIEVSTSEDSLSEFAKLMKKSNDSIIEIFGCDGPSCSERVSPRTYDESLSSYGNQEESFTIVPQVNCKKQYSNIEEDCSGSSLDMCSILSSSKVPIAQPVVASLVRSSTQEDVELHIPQTSAGGAPTLASISASSCIDEDITCMTSENCATSGASGTSAVLANLHFSGESSEEQDVHLYKMKYSDVSALEDSSADHDNKHTLTSSVSADNSRANNVAQAEVGKLGTGQWPHLESHELKICPSKVESHKAYSRFLPDRNNSSAQSEALVFLSENTAQSQVGRVLLNRDCNVDPISVTPAENTSEGTSLRPNAVRTGASGLSEMSTATNSIAPNRVRWIDADKSCKSSMNSKEPISEIPQESPSPNVSSCSSVSEYRTAANPPATLAFSGGIHPYETNSRGDSIVELRFTAPNGDVLRKERVNILAGDEHMLLEMEAMNVLNERDPRCNELHNLSPTTTPKHKWRWFKSKQ